MIKNSQQKEEQRGTSPLDKEHLQNPSANIILNGENGSFPTKPVNKAKMLSLITSKHLTGN